MKSCNNPTLREKVNQLLSEVEELYEEAYISRLKERQEFKQREIFEGFTEL